MHRRRVATLAPLTLVLLVGLGASPASAQTEAQMDEEARVLFSAGREAFAAERYEEALARFEAAYALRPYTMLLYNIGLSARRLDRYERALEAFEQYLRESPDAENRRAVEAEIRLLRRTLAGEGDAEPAAERGPPVEAWVLTGIGAAVAVAGAVLLAVVGADLAALENPEDGAPFPRDVYDRTAPMSIAGFVSLGVGVALSTGGLIWALSASGGSETSGTVALRGAW